ncbi:MAG: M15 family metallopeptidase [Bacteroidales bacterium]|nr:M15 family metallopeptidase [Candidatus Cacconaster merdequi]
MRRFLIFILAASLTFGFDGCRRQSSLVDESDAVPQGFVRITDVVPDVLLEIRYFSTYNFVGKRIDGYERPVALCTREAADALKQVSDDALSLGYRLKIYDAYRPQRAVDHFVRWGADASDTLMRRNFYPDVPRDSLFELGYICEKSSHSRGSTVDLTLFDTRTQKEADMGGVFDWFGPLSAPDSPDVTAEQHANRMLLRELMLKHGFNPYEAEWWHFTLKDEPYPDTYFDHPVK